MEKKMIDLAKIKVRAGKGGDGLVSFRRAKHVAKGGPDGGDGGNGGDVYALADHNLATLMDFRSKKIFKAGDGRSGGDKNKRGYDGEDIEIKMPLGTLIYEMEDEKEILVADMDEDGKKVLLARGGKGGVGNKTFSSSTNRAPRQFTRGKLGEEKEVKLEVKLIADVGLVGAPNAGKSTLINKLTNAQAKIGSYPFTTISPNLGVLELKGGEKVVISDIPGLIEGASEGKGLGDEFLRHVERTRLLVQMIDPYDPDADLVDNSLQKYKMIQRELQDYEVDLTQKEQIVVINKVDVTEVAEAFSKIKEAFEEQLGIEVLAVSAVTGEGLEELVNTITQKLSEIPAKPFTEKPTPVKIYTIENIPNKRLVYGQKEVIELE
jgi:GTP-binding protein